MTSRNLSVFGNIIHSKEREVPGYKQGTLTTVGIALTGSEGCGKWEE